MCRSRGEERERVLKEDCVTLCNILCPSESKPPIPHPWPLNSYTFQPNRKFYFQCKTLILQFTLGLCSRIDFFVDRENESKMVEYHLKIFFSLIPLVQLLCGLLTFILSIIGEYEEGSFSPSSSYLWIMLATNFSITISLYYLGLCILSILVNSFSLANFVSFDLLHSLLCFCEIIYISHA